MVTYIALGIQALLTCLVCDPVSDQRHDSGSLCQDHQRPINLYKCTYNFQKNYVCLSHQTFTTWMAPVGCRDETLCLPYFFLLQHIFRPMIITSLFTVRSYLADSSLYYWEWKKLCNKSFPNGEDKDKESFLLHNFYKIYNTLIEDFFLTVWNDSMFLDIWLIIFL